jgi:imidazolonepropionase-like amidohydrolase
VIRTASAAILAAAACAAAAQGFPIELEKDRIPSTRTGGNALIQGARLLTAAGPVIESGDVLIQNGRIAAVGKGLKAPAGTLIIDGRGRTLTPGIVDAHSHRGSDGTNEGADSITAEVRIADVLNLGALNVWQALASGHTTALILHGSANAVGGESVVIKYKHRRPKSEAIFPGAPRMIKFALGENVTRKTDGNSTRFPLSRMGQEAVYRRAFAEAKAYQAAWDAYDRGERKQTPRRDLRLQTLADILAGKVWVNCHSYRSDEMLMMARLSKEYGFHLVLQHAVESYKIAPELAELGVGVSIFMDNWSFKVEGYDSIPWNAWISHKAGVLVGINTDGTNGTTALNIDAAKLMRFGGISEEEAIKFITINPAIQLGIDKRVGSIEAGKDADLALWDGNPLSVYSRPRMTLIEGEVYFERRDAFGFDSSSIAKTKLDPLPAAAEEPTLPAARAYAIVGADVHPISGPMIPGGTVVIEDGRISAVGKGIAIPAGARVVQARGRRVYPGFFDAYSQLGLGEIEPVNAMMDNRELGQQQPDLDAATAIWVESTHFGPARYNGVTNSFIGPSFGRISGRGAVIHTDGLTTEQFTLRRQAGLLATLPAGAGAQFGEIEADLCDHGLFEDALLGGGGRSQENHGDENLSAVDRDRFYDILGGRWWQEGPAGADEKAETTPLDEAFEAALKYSVDRRLGTVPLDLGLEAMRPYVQGRLPWIIQASSPAAIRSAVAFVQRRGIRAVLRVGTGAWKEADLLAKSEIPVILNPAGRITLGANSPASAWDPYDSPYAAAGYLARKGVKIAFSSGGGDDVMLLPFRVGMHCAYGLSQEDALRALTLWPAQMFGVDDQLGSLEPGKLANFIITEGDPFELTGRVRQVFINGKPRAMVSKHTQLRDKYAARLN